MAGFVSLVFFFCFIANSALYSFDIIACYLFSHLILLPTMTITTNNKHDTRIRQSVDKALMLECVSIEGLFVECASCFVVTFERKLIIQNIETLADRIL